MELDRKELINIVAFSLVQNRSLLGRKPGEREFAILAGKVMAQLELCRVTFSRKPPEALHKTP